MGRGGHKGVHKTGRFQHLLEVVQEQEEFFVAQKPLQAFKKGFPARLHHAECLGDGRGDEAGVVDCGQADEKHAVVEVFKHFRRHL